MALFACTVYIVLIYSFKCWGIVSLFAGIPEPLLRENSSLNTFFLSTNHILGAGWMSWNPWCDVSVVCSILSTRPV